MQSHSHASAHVILKAHVWYVACLQHCIMCLPIDYWFIHFLHFLLLSFFTIVLLCAYIQLFIYFAFRWSFFFIRVPVTNNHLNAPQTIVCTRSYSAPSTCYHLSVVQIIVRTELYKIFFCLYIKQETQQTMYVGYGPQWHRLKETSQYSSSITHENISDF